MQKKSHLPVFILMAIIIAALGIAGCGATASSGSAPSADHEWTVLVYLAADNDLASASYYNMKQMEQIGSTNDVKIVVQWDKSVEFPGAYWTGCRRLLVKQDFSDSIASVNLEVVGDAVNSGDPIVLGNFLKWGIHKYPARKYALILWDHGSGWKTVTGESNGKGICWDATFGDDYLTEGDLRYALNQTIQSTNTKFDVIGMDACLMGTVEGAYDLKTYANYLVSSEVLIPGEGYPYNTILGDLADTPSMDGYELGKSIVDRYMEYYASGETDRSKSLNMSMVNFSKMDDVVTALSALSTALSENMDTASSKEGKTYGDGTITDSPDYTDVVNLAAFLKETSSVPAVVAAAQSLESKCTEAIVYEKHGEDVPYYHGLSLWLPAQEDYNQYASIYQGLAFSLNCTWDEYLARVYQ